jgi:hypothetical protein
VFHEINGESTKNVHKTKLIGQYSSPLAAQSHVTPSLYLK